MAYRQSAQLEAMILHLMQGVGISENRQNLDISEAYREDFRRFLGQAGYFRHYQAPFEWHALDGKAELYARRDDDRSSVMLFPGSITMLRDNPPFCLCLHSSNPRTYNLLMQHDAIPEDEAQDFLTRLFDSFSENSRVIDKKSFLEGIAYHPER